MLTRRNAITAAGGTLLLAGCGGAKVLTRAGNPRDLHLLAGALELEREQVALYERALRAPLTRSQATLARELLAQERTHAATIAELIRELGGTPAALRPAAAYTHALPAAGAAAGAWIKIAVAREQAAVVLYGGAIPRLVNARLKATLAAIMTTEAEHAAALGLA